jgi:hypothetical protein
LLLFPSSDITDEKATIILYKLKINANQESLLNAIVGTILPEGEIPGGLTAKSNNFIWYYIDDCVSPEDQTNFINSLIE